MVKTKVVLDWLANFLTMKKPRHNRALRDLLDLTKSIEDFCARYRLQEELSGFKAVFASMGQARIDATEITFQTGLRIRRARNIEGKNLPALVENTYNVLEEFKRALYTRTLSEKTLRERVLKLDMSFENLLAAISEIEYK